MLAPGDELLASRSHQTPSRRIALFVARALDSKASLLAGYFVTVYFAFVVFSIYFVFLQTFENFKGTKNGSTAKRIQYKMSRKLA